MEYSQRSFDRQASNIKAIEILDWFNKATGLTPSITIATQSENLEAYTDNSRHLLTNALLEDLTLSIAVKALHAVEEQGGKIKLEVLYSLANHPYRISHDSDHRMVYKHLIKPLAEKLEQAGLVVSTIENERNQQHGSRNTSENRIFTGR